MQHVAAEMQRDDYFRIKKIPLLIGGATTSRVHTAVKIAPHYEGPVVYVPDASRSVGVCSDLLSDERAAKFIADLHADYEQVRELHASKKPTPLVTLAAGARQQDADRLGRLHAAEAQVHRPARVPQLRPRRARGLHRLGPVLPDLGPGRHVSRDPARRDRRQPRRSACFSDGKRMLQRADRRPLAAGARRDRPVAGQHGGRRRHRDLRRRVAQRGAADAGTPLRMQTERPVSTACRGPTAAWPTSSRPRACADDYVGLFAVTAGLGVEKKEQQFVADHDDYTAIMLKALADRLAEAFAERLHQRVRTELWGYAPDEALEQRRADRREVPRHPPGARATRPAPTTASSATCSACCGATRSAWTLTESLAMTPAASVSGFYLAHPRGDLLQRRPHRRRPARATGRARWRIETRALPNVRSLRCCK